MNEYFKQAYLSQLEQSADWLKNLRAENFNKFSAQGLPSKKLEEWKYTDISSLANYQFQLASSVIANHDDFISKHFIANSHILVFVNGHYAPHLSKIDSLPKEVILTNLAQMLQKQPDLIKPHLTADSEQSLQQLNFALMSDGAFLYIPKNIILEKPIQLLFLASVDESMQHVRNIIVVEENAIINVIESYVSETDKKYLTNSNTAIFIEKNSQLNYFKNQFENTQTWHLGHIKVQQKAASRVQMHSISLGGQLSRDNLTIGLNEVGAECALHGLYLANQNQHMDHHIRIDHAVPNGQSYQLYKGIMTDKAKAVFNGKIIVHKQAQRTRAQQTNQNLLLTKAAEINTKPELEIYADDVQCTHGATIGKLDDQALFYLQSRGIESAMAKTILTHAFASEVIDSINNSDIKNYINNDVQRKLADFSEN